MKTRQNRSILTGLRWRTLSLNICDNFIIHFPSFLLSDRVFLIGLARKFTLLNPQSAEPTRCVCLGWGGCRPSLHSSWSPSPCSLPSAHSVSHDDVPRTRSRPSFLSIHTTSLRARIYFSVDCFHGPLHVCRLPHHGLIVSKLLNLICQ